MYLMNLTDEFLIDGVSTRFKQLMNKQSCSLKNCFFLSMLDSDVPDQLAEDLEKTLKRGIVYNTMLKLNVLEKSQWFDVTIVRRFEQGWPVGYRVKFEKTNPNELKLTQKTYRKIKDGELALQHGFPIKNKTNKDLIHDEKKIWSQRVK